MNDPADLTRDDKDLERRLSEYVKEKETDENMELLAKKLKKEWEESSEDSPAPDLSYSRFEEKLNQAKDQ